MKRILNVYNEAGRAFSGLPVRFVKFCLVGGSGVIIDMGVLFLLAEPSMLHLPVVLSKVIAAETAMVNNFVWNELWTFRERTEGRTRFRERLGRFIRFNAICSGGLVIAILALKVLVDGFGLNLYLSNLAAIVGATAWNFGMNCAFNWATPGKRG